MANYDKGSSSDDPNDPETFGHLPYLQLKTSSHLIIPQWSTSSIYGLVAAMLAAIFAGFGYEFINEYSRHLHNRYIRNNRSKCCGIEMFGCCEKLFLSILVIIRVVIGYFMMLCVMTMNIWLLVSVTLGAGIGYSICKPIIANRFVDSISPYEYPVVRLTTPDEDDDDDFVGNVAMRSHSWRYRPPSKRLIESTGRRLMESTLSDQEGNVNQRLSGDYSRFSLRPRSSNQNGINVISIRESKRGTTTALVSDVKDEEDAVFLRDKSDNGPETRTTFSQTFPSPQSRFKSTSLVINQAFKSESLPSQRQSRVNSGTGARSSRSPKTGGRFQPISKVIIDQRTSVDKV